MKGLLVLFTVMALVGSLRAVCPQNTVCRNQRDVIYQTEESVTPKEKIFHRGRAWYIRPEQLPTNTLLAFEKFKSSPYATVIVITYHAHKAKTTQYLYGNLGNFQLLFKEAIGVIIYVPVQGPTAPNFVLKYYTGCGVLTTNNHQVRYDNSLEQKAGTACWFIEQAKPIERQRIYFSLRNVQLSKGQEITVWDVHTSQVIARVKNSARLETFAAESNGLMSIMIETKPTPAILPKEKEVKFLLSYHVLKTPDIACIQRKQDCESDPKLMTKKACKEKCKVFERMMMEEIELNVRHFPKRRNGSDTKTFGYPKKCPWVPSKCVCQRSKVNHLDYCDLTIDCMQVDGCAKVCFFAQLITCPQLTVLDTVSLL